MRAIVVAAFFLCGGAVCEAQSRRADSLAQGSILIMERDAPDPLFAHSVIVLAHYDKSGTVGLMLHYRSNIPIQKALHGLAGAEKRTDPMFVGGPVEMDSVMGLLRTATPPAQASHVAGKVYLVTSREEIQSALNAAKTFSDLRMFLGYAGWAPGQLEHEVQLGGWWIFDYDESLVFDEHPETLWDRLIKRTVLQRVSLPFLDVPSDRLRAQSFNSKNP